MSVTPIPTMTRSAALCGHDCNAKERVFGRVLITGAGGFLGAAIADALLAQNVDITASDIGSVASRHDKMVACEVADFERVDALIAKVTEWLAPLEPLRKLQLASKSEDATSWARALLLNLLDGHGVVTRERAGIENLPKEARPFLRKVGVVFGALDIYAPALLKPAPRLAMKQAGIDTRPIDDAMRSVIPATKPLPAGYRPAGDQLVRVDIAEKLFKQAHEARAGRAAKDQAGGKRGRGAPFVLDTALAVSTGLTPDSIKRLLGAAGFRMVEGKAVAEGVFGPALPDRWRWQPARDHGGERRHDAKGQRPNGRGKQSGKGRGPKEKRQDRGNHGAPKPREPRPENAFAALKDMLS